MPSTLGIVDSTWTPLTLAPSLWLDAADTTTITESGGSVSQWDDKSGDGRDFTQGSGALQPQTGTRSINNRNVLDFSSDQLESSAISVVSQLDGTFTSFAVIEADSVSGTSFVLNGDFGIAPPRAPQFLRIDNGDLRTIRVHRFDDVQAVVIVTDTSAVSLGNTQIIRAMLDSSDLLAISDTTSGTSAGSSGGATTAQQIHHIGGRNNVQYFDGAIAEILVYPYALTANQIAQVDNYFISKWGV